MKRLLLAPLLFLLVSCSSDLTVNRRTETYLELCNNSELPGNSRDYVYCYKATGKDREKITAKGFIEASKELSRILTKNGIFVCMVPIIEGWNETYENNKIIDDKDRWLHFGQNNHVRFYGKDFRKT